MPMHVDMSDNQMFENGPAPRLLNGYEVDSISNFHLCGAGTFPGGAVTGIPRRNAANQILRQISPSS